MFVQKRFVRPKTCFLGPKTWFVRPKTWFVRPKTCFVRPKTCFLGQKTCFVRPNICFLGLKTFLRKVKQDKPSAGGRILMAAFHRCFDYFAFLYVYICLLLWEHKLTYMGNILLWVYSIFFLGKYRSWEDLHLIVGRFQPFLWDAFNCGKI